MKKALALILGLVLVFVLSFNAFAASTEAQEDFKQKFTVTGGIDLSKEVETTFDKARTISGTAEVGSVIKISVYEVFEDGNCSEPEIYEVTVGSSGYFSQGIDLSVGKNLVTITAVKEDLTATIKANIKRKKSEIKSELFKNISFPKVF